MAYVTEHGLRYISFNKHPRVKGIVIMYGPFVFCLLEIRIGIH